MELAQWQQLLHEHFKELSLQHQSQPAKAPVFASNHQEITSYNCISS
jgi:hypothetical protein